MSVREQHPDPEWRKAMRRAHRDAIRGLTLCRCNHEADEHDLLTDGYEPCSVSGCMCMNWQAAQ